jgi:F-type H+-transporting ATPase subunit b
MRNWLSAAIACTILAVTCGALYAAGDHGEKKPPMGVEKGLFVGAIETSLWTIVVFFTLFFVLRRFAWGPIVTGLNKREQSIAQDRREADLAKQEAAAMRDRMAAEMARADAEVRAKLDKVRTDADALAAEREAQSKADVAAQKARLQHEMSIAEEQVRKAVMDDAAKLATLISAKTIKKHLTEADHRALVDEALNDFRAAAQKRKSDLENATA